MLISTLKQMNVNPLLIKQYFSSGNNNIVNRGKFVQWCDTSNLVLYVNKTMELNLDQLVIIVLWSYMTQDMTHGSAQISTLAFTWMTPSAWRSIPKVCVLVYSRDYIFMQTLEWVEWPEDYVF